MFAVVDERTDLESSLDRCGDFCEAWQIGLGKDLCCDKLIEVLRTRITVRDHLERDPTARSQPGVTALEESPIDLDLLSRCHAGPDECLDRFNRNDCVVWDLR